MQTTVVRLMRFVHGLRSDFFEAAATLGWKEFCRDQGTSLGSYRNIFLHLASVEEQHVTKFCEGIPALWPSWRSEISTARYRDLDAVRARLESVTLVAEEKFRRWESPRALDEKVWWVRRGHPLRVTRETALTQCTTEHLLHLGEIEAMLWQRNIEPPTTLWIDREVLHGRPPAPPPVAVVRAVARSRARRSRVRAPPATAARTRGRTQRVRR